MCSSHTTIAALVAFVLDLTLAREDDAASKDSGLQWWERFNWSSSNVKSDEFYSLHLEYSIRLFHPIETPPYVISVINANVVLHPFSILVSKCFK
ncbi:hypothetical protein Fmac_015791 [Flemingia macrophylla]|uniref:Secreted protein n=1 Tax=Flemingia macrophylla TaxID=520843 RepID=A0ABD1MGF8_9FABA